MNKKVILVLVDGMRPDAFLQCGHPFVETLKKASLHSMKVKTVMPSVTLPCHMSLFHSVPPERHGVVTNTYTPQVRPVRGLCEVLRAAGKSCALFYSWDELRDITRPNSIVMSQFINMYDFANSDDLITEACIDGLKKHAFDFTFLYLGKTDGAGHDHGWMSENQLETVSNAIACIQKIYDMFGKDYTIIITADHGGHGRGHGTIEVEDMTTPLLILGEGAGVISQDASIMDIAPTIAKLMSTKSDPEWEGKALL